MPMFLHEREAHKDFLKLLKEYIPKIEDVVVHCFTGDKISLKNYLDLDCYIGITGWITDPKRGSHLHDIIKYIPSDKLMIETDSPYLIPFYDEIENKKYNEPSNLVYVIDAISNILKKDKTLLSKELYNNTCKFFNLDDE
jgi:TatD DNase family protein